MRKTNIKLRNYVFYQIFVRNFSEAGNFKAIIDDLERIRDLGVKVIMLMPVHPIGDKDRIGSQGSPYAIKQYDAIREDLGSKDDFQALIDAVHGHDMKLMMDVVFNHTAKDSILHEEHPEWFFKDDQGQSTSKVHKWTDVYDFNYSSDKALWFELFHILVDYARMGVDGYRCDTASMIPIDFWKMARKHVRKVNRKFIWLSESIRGKHCKELRDMGLNCLSESELYEVFDMALDLDVEPAQKAYLKGEGPFRAYIEGLRRQEEVYPANYVKLHHIESYDSERIAKRLNNDLDKIYNWTGFLFFQKGASLLYAGQEFTSDHLPSLHEKDLIKKNEDISEFIKKLSKLKRKKIFAQGIYHVHMPKVDEVAYLSYKDHHYMYHGIFNLGQRDGQISVYLNDGRYRNVLNKKIIKVENGMVDLKKDPIIIREKLNG